MLVSESTIDKIKNFQHSVLEDLPPRNMYIKQSLIVDFTKSTMLLLCVSLMFIYQNFSRRAVLYTSLHGSYGMIWFLKSFYFPDPRFQKKASLGSSIILCIALCVYYTLPFSTISRTDMNEITNGRFIFSIFIFSLGVFYMVGSDAQKFFTLKYKKGLITEGFMSNTRNPNYFGEYLIYTSFLVVCQQWKIYMIVYCMWSGLFLFILTKDSSLVKKEGAKQYFQKASLFYPKIFDNQNYHWAFWASAYVFSMILCRI